MVSYLTPVGSAVALPLPIEDVLGRAAVDGVALEVGSEPAGRIVVEEALRLLEALPLVPRHAGVGEFRVEVVEEL